MTVTVIAQHKSPADSGLLIANISYLSDEQANDRLVTDERVALPQQRKEIGWRERRLAILERQGAQWIDFVQQQNVGHGRYALRKKCAARAG
jgi:hypothetical protein